MKQYSQQQHSQQQHSQQHPVAGACSKRDRKGISSSRKRGYKHMQTCIHHSKRQRQGHLLLLLLSLTLLSLVGIQ
jgi:hypothetical protein